MELDALYKKKNNNCSNHIMHVVFPRRFSIIKARCCMRRLIKKYKKRGYNHVVLLAQESKYYFLLYDCEQTPFSPFGVQKYISEKQGQMFCKPTT